LRARLQLLKKKGSHLTRRRETTMRNTFLLMGLLLLLSASVAAPLYGWDDEGHMMVAYVAYQQLTPAARSRANALLKLNPKYNDWVATLPAASSQADKDMMIFMIAATWPDKIKLDASYTSDGSDDGDRPDGSPDPTRNTGYDDKLMHKYWHFVDQPFATDGSPLPSIPTPNAQDRIALFRSVLASDASDALKSYDLTWLLHLTGDVHQPLHCAKRVDTSDLQGDAGGNQVKLQCKGCPSELHGYWDDVLGTSKPPRSAITVAKRLASPDPILAGKSSEADWVIESFQDARDEVYVIPVGDGHGPFQLTGAYKTAAKNLARQRIALAGARLANILNNEMK
jgi:S1/P1 Nuclease